VIRALQTCFRRAAQYRFAALLLRPPWPGRRAALVELAGETSWSDGPDPGPVAEAEDAAVEAEAFRVLGQAGDVSALSSDYVGSGYADKGPILADVAGFYRAFGYEPSLREPPDHFAAIFEFLSFLSLKRTWALLEGDPEQARIAQEAEEKLRAEHLDGRFGRFLERLEEKAPEGGTYREVARFLAEGVPGTREVE